MPRRRNPAPGSAPVALTLPDVQALLARALAEPIHPERVVAALDPEVTRFIAAEADPELTARACAVAQHLPEQEEQEVCAELISAPENLVHAVVARGDAGTLSWVADAFATQPAAVARRWMPRLVTADSFAAAMASGDPGCMARMAFAASFLDPADGQPLLEQLVNNHDQPHGALQAVADAGGARAIGQTAAALSQLPDVPERSAALAQLLSDGAVEAVCAAAGREPGARRLQPLAQVAVAAAGLPGDRRAAVTDLVLSDGMLQALSTSGHPATLDGAVRAVQACPERAAVPHMLATILDTEAVGVMAGSGEVATVGSLLTGIACQPSGPREEHIEQVVSGCAALVTVAGAGDVAALEHAIGTLGNIPGLRPDVRGAAHRQLITPETLAAVGARGSAELVSWMANATGDLPAPDRAAALAAVLTPRATAVVAASGLPHRTARTALAASHLPPGEARTAALLRLLPEQALAHLTATGTAWDILLTADALRSLPAPQRAGLAGALLTDRAVDAVIAHGDAHASLNGCCTLAALVADVPDVGRRSELLSHLLPDGCLDDLASQGHARAVHDAAMGLVTLAPPERPMALQRLLTPDAAARTVATLNDPAITGELAVMAVDGLPQEARADVLRAMLPREAIDNVAECGTARDAVNASLGALWAPEGLRAHALRTLLNPRVLNDVVRLGDPVLAGRVLCGADLASDPAGIVRTVLTPRMVDAAATCGHAPTVARVLGAAAWLPRDRCEAVTRQMLTEGNVACVLAEGDISHTSHLASAAAWLPREDGARLLERVLTPETLDAMASEGSLGSIERTAASVAHQLGGLGRALVLSRLFTSEAVASIRETALESPHATIRMADSARHLAQPLRDGVMRQLVTPPLLEALVASRNADSLERASRCVDALPPSLRPAARAALSGSVRVAVPHWQEVVAGAAPAPGAQPAAARPRAGPSPLNR